MTVEPIAATLPMSTLTVLRSILHRHDQIKISLELHAVGCPGQLERAKTELAAADALAALMLAAVQ